MPRDGTEEISHFWKMVAIHGKYENIISENVFNDISKIINLSYEHKDECITSIVYEYVKKNFLNNNIDDIYLNIVKVYLSFELIAKMRRLREDMCYHFCDQDPVAYRGHKIAIEVDEKFGDILMNFSNQSLIRNISDPIFIEQLILRIETDTTIKNLTNIPKDIFDSIFNQIDDPNNVNILKTIHNLIIVVRDYYTRFPSNYHICNPIFRHFSSSTSTSSSSSYKYPSRRTYIDRDKPDD